MLLTYLFAKDLQTFLPLTENRVFLFHESKEGQAAYSFWLCFYEGQYRILL